MQVAREAVSSTQTRMTVTLTSDRVQKAYDEELAKAQKSVRINGFRPGKIPLSLVRQRYGAAIRKDVVQSLVQQTIASIIEEDQMDLVGYPMIEKLDQEAGQDVAFVALFETFPAVSFDQLSTLNVRRPQVEITEADIDEMLLTLRRQVAVWNEVSRPVAAGDRVSLLLAQKPAEGSEVDWSQAQPEQLMLIESQPALDGLDALYGMEAGQSKLLDLTFHEYHPEKGGHVDVVVQVLVRIEKVEEAILPEVDAEFMARFDEQESTDLEGFRSRLKELMQNEVGKAVTRILKRGVFLQIADLNPEAKAPRALVGPELSRIGKSLETLRGIERIKLTGLDQDLRMQRFTGEAEQSARMALVIRSIAKAQSLQVDEQRLYEAISKVAMLYENPGQVFEFMLRDENARRSLEFDVLSDQALDWALSQVAVQDESVSYRDVFARIPSALAG